MLEKVATNIWNLETYRRLHYKQAGGLGVRNLKMQNDCFLMKWLWRFNGNEQVLWKEQGGNLE